MHKKTIDRLQNLAMVVLSLTAVLILLRLPIVRNGWQGKVSTILHGHSSAENRDQLWDIEETISTLHFVMTGDGEYGRFGQLYASRDNPLLEQILPLFREAIGSAGEMSVVADRTLQTALKKPSLYLDLCTILPQSVAAGWLGERMYMDRDVRSLALSAEEDTASLYLVCRDGEILKYKTALPSAAILDQTQDVAPNGCRFAFETNYGPLAPYTVLVSELPQAPILSSGVPLSYTAFNLLSALDFNPYTTFRYTENSGVEVVEESPHTLRIGPDGTVVYIGGENVTDDLYKVPSREDWSAEINSLAAAKRIAAALTEGTGAAPLTLSTVEAVDDGFRVTFSYEVGGLPVYFQNGDEALEVITSGDTVSSFTYHCRSYTIQEGSAELLPPEMAVAVASLHPGAGLSLGYVDGGCDALTAQWLAK